MQIAQIKYGCQCGWSVPQYATTCPWKNEPTSTESTSNVIRNDVAADLALQTRAHSIMNAEPPTGVGRCGGRNLCASSSLSSIVSARYGTW